MKRLVLPILTAILFFTSCTTRINRQICTDDLKSYMEFLASDSLKGREPGTTEDSILMNFIAGRFRQSGLSAPGGNYIQNFELVTGVEVDDNCRAGTSAVDLKAGTDFYPLGFSASAETSARVIFGGYGIGNEKTGEYNDYSTIDPTGCWIMLFRGSPENRPELVNFSSDRDKAMLAREKGAIGVIFIAGKKMNKEDKLDSRLANEPSLPIPVIQMTRAGALKLFTEGSFSLDDQESLLEKSSVQNVIITQEIFTADLRISKLSTRTGNVIGILEGHDPVLKNEWIVIGAHHDHLGMGGPGNSSRMPDTIAVHNGADDNASGVAAVLELAEYFGEARPALSRSLLFATFGAEEKGLVGSRHLAENLPEEAGDIFAMVNMDMLGRMSDDSVLQVGGTGTSAEAEGLLNSINADFGFNLSLSEAGYGPSDHASFYSKDIPVFFFTTGAHKDYHTPFDDVDSINFAGLERSTLYVSELVKKLSSLDSLRFRESGPKVSSGRAYTGSVTLGIMPDVSGGEQGGLKVLAVTNGKPGAAAGLKKGDIITALDQNRIENVYDYMYRLKNYKAGDSAVLTILRNGKELELLVHF